MIALAITSQPQRASFPLTLKLQSGTLPKDAWVKISQIRILSIKGLGNKLGQVTAEEMDRLIEGLNEIVA